MPNYVEMSITDTIPASEIFGAAMPKQEKNDETTGDDNNDE